MGLQTQGKGQSYSCVPSFLHVWKTQVVFALLLITVPRGPSSLTAGPHCRPTWGSHREPPGHPSARLALWDRGFCSGQAPADTPSPAPRHPPEAPGWLSSEARTFFTSNLRSWARGGLGGQGSCGAGEGRWRCCGKRRSSDRGRPRTEAAAEPEPGSALWQFPL